MRSIVGVGMTPPNVLGTPKPESSVMMSRIFGACLGGTMRGAHHAFDWRAPSLITPPRISDRAPEVVFRYWSSSRGASGDCRWFGFAEPAANWQMQYQCKAAYY